jgi:hypothetical protein
MPVSQGTVVKSFVSAIDFLDQRDIDPKLYDVARDRALTDVMRVTKRYKPAKMFNYHNFVNNNVWETSVISAVTSTGLAQITFTVNTSTGFPRKGDLIKTTNTNNIGKQALITNVTTASGTATITARTPNNVPFYATVGDTVGYQSNAVAEKSDTLASRRYQVTKYFNLIQGFREADDISDVQKVALVEIEINGEYHYLPYQLIQKVTSLNGQISAQMIAGVQSTTQFGDTNPFLVDPNGNGLPVQTTGGLDWYITTYGTSDQADVLGTLSLTDLESMIDNQIANKAPLDLMLISGVKPKRAFDRLVKNLGSSGITSVRLVLSGNEADFNVDRLSYSNATFDFVYLPIIDHPQLFGPSLTPDINGSFYIIPKDEIETVGGGMEPRIQIRYTPSPFMGASANMSSNGYIAEWRTGALAGVPTTSVVNLHTDWYTMQGLECIGVQHMQKFRVI